MGNYEQLKQAVSNVIKLNGTQAITGEILQNTLLTIISTIGNNATFAGIATPATNPGTPDQNVFYLASQNGIYSNFGGIELKGQVLIFYNKNGKWVKADLGIATSIKVSELENSKQDKLTFDNIPTNGSNNPVTSSGIRLALDKQKNEVDEAKNEALQAIKKNEQSAIENFNAQRVTPEMLSESTKQFIEASGGGTITNLADDEDITSKENNLGINVLKFADRRYNNANFSGKGYKILRKNIVDGKNILTQDMINETNTIYQIRYDFNINGAEIKVPDNCVLQFDGGSLSNGILNLNYCNIVGKGLKCEIKNIPNIGLPLSSFLCDVSDKDLNTKIFNVLVKEYIPILVDYHNIYFSGEITISNYPPLIETIGLNNANLFFTENSNQRGFVFTASTRMAYFNRINLYANGNTIDFSKGFVYRSKFSNMEVTSNNGHCFYAGDNLIGGGHGNFDITFEKVHVISPNGNGFYGVNGNTIKFIAVSSASIGDSLFYNCQGVFIGCNNQYAQTTGITFYKARKNISGRSERFNSIFINCNFEDYKGVLFDCENFGYLHLEFHGCSFYPFVDSKSGKIKESPLKLDGLIQLVILNCRGLISTLYEDGVGMVYIPSLISSAKPVIIDYIGNQKLTICDANGNYRTISPLINKKYEKSIMSKDTEYKEYDLIENINTKIILASKYLFNNKDTIEINNTNSTTTGSLLFSDKIPQGLINLLCTNDLDGYTVNVIYWNIILSGNDLSNQPFRLIIKNNNTICPITFRNTNGAGAPNYGFNSKDGNNFTLNPGCSMEVLIMPPSYLNKSYGIVFLLNDFNVNLRSKGTKPQRPTLQLSDEGFEYYDSTLKKKILWNGTDWTNIDGTTL